MWLASSFFNPFLVGVSVFCLLVLLVPVAHANDLNASINPACEPNTSTDENVYRFYADLDGVDGRDTFVADRSGGTTVITACDDEHVGPWDMGDANKPLQIIVVDIEGDGKDELLLGGATATSPFSGNISALTDGKLVDKDFVSFHPAMDHMDGETIGCSGANASGLNTIVNYTYTQNTDGSLLSWKSTDDQLGNFKLPNEATRAWLFRSGLCGNRVLFNYEVAFQPGYLAAHLKPGSTIALGINNQLLAEKSATELSDPNNWQIPVQTYAGYEGPFQLGSLMERSRVILVGEHNHCVGGPLPRPEFKEKGLIQLSLQPAYTDSCLNWFAVDLWVRADFTIAAIILNLWEP